MSWTIKKKKSFRCYKCGRDRRNCFALIHKMKSFCFNCMEVRMNYYEDWHKQKIRDVRKVKASFKNRRKTMEAAEMLANL